ncbi:hypothetical protein F5H01DRAFT_75539 [Linnemannia elongata]|nr:hypothetical protein F5H01DRAFT_75539 [Linnemannia elongata]
MLTSILLLLLTIGVACASLFAGQFCDPGYTKPPPDPKACMLGYACVEEVAGMYACNKSPLADGSPCTLDTAVVCRDRCIDEKCAPKSDVGGRCHVTSDCIYREVANYSICVNNICTPRSTGAPAGTPCKSNPECAGYCLDGTCRSPGEKGTCTNGSDCGDGNWDCVDGKCARR